MTVKNADMPAMPSGIEQDGYNPGHSPAVWGLTKREVFAMHAPEVPDWYEKEFAMIHSNNKDYYHSFTDEFAEHCPTTYQEILPPGRMALIKAWRYAYADLMLGE